MPPLPRLRVAALDELARQLRYSPPEAARRHLAHAEQLVDQIDPRATYPEDWVVFRITGFRPEKASPELIVGEALIADIGALVERLSAAAQMSEDELRAESGSSDDGWLTIEELTARWHVSRKTVERYRRFGLMARRARGRTGKPRLLFSRAIVERFESRFGEMLRQAAEFSRIPTDVAVKMIRRAARYRELLGWSLNTTAKRLAERFGRGHETVRQLLLRNDRSSVEPIFANAGPISPSEARLIERADRRGIDLALVAQRLNKSTGSIHRALCETRASRLQDLELRGPAAPEFEHDEYVSAALSRPGVASGLGRAGPRHVIEFVADAERQPAMSAESERRLAEAFCLLRWRAHRAVRSLSHSAPTFSEVERIETDLRWAARLKAELVRSQAALVVKSIETRLGRPVSTLPAAVSARVVTLAVRAVCEAADRFDPFKGGRLAAPAGLAVNKVLAKWAAGEGAAWAAPLSPEKATPRPDPSGAVLEDFTRRVSEWQPWLELDPRIERALEFAPESVRELVCARFGIPPRADAETSRPLSAVEIARRRQLPVFVVTRRLRDAMHELLTIDRSEQ